MSDKTDCTEYSDDGCGCDAPEKCWLLSRPDTPDVDALVACVRDEFIQHTGSVKPVFALTTLADLARKATPQEGEYDFDAALDSPECLRESLVLAREHIEHLQAALDTANREREAWEAVAGIVAREGGESAMRLLEALKAGPPSPLFAAAAQKEE